MIIRIGYGTRAGEKKLAEGSFICPFCLRKRTYERYLLQKRFWFFAKSFAPLSAGDIGEFVLCMSCLRPFTPEVLDSSFQLTAEFDSTSPDPSKIFDSWKVAYDDLGCEDLLSSISTFAEGVSPYLKTVAHNMRSGGMQLRFGDYEEARKYFVANIKAGVLWNDSNIKYNLKLEETKPLSFQKMEEHVEAAHFVLSLLP